jgi:hypothetical protein
VGIAGHTWRARQFERRGRELYTPGGVTEVAGIELRSGINVELRQYSAAELDRALSDIASLGFYWVRQHFSWRAIEPQPGTYEWAQWDVLVDAVRDHQLGTIAVLDDPPAWASRREGMPLPCVPPWEQDAWARFVSAFASRYGEAIVAYQVWDEPNLSRSWGGGHVAPCAYAVLLEAAYPAIHAADPTAWVLGGGLAPTQANGPGDLNDLTYLRELYAAGGGPYFDILATKPYGFWSGPEDRRVAPDVLNYSRVIALREVMRARRDGNKPIWAVEWGWNVLPVAWAGDPPPWGTDVLWMQRPRIEGAISRARGEWPWLGTMCWATYQPDVPPTDPRWGFALRHRDGSPTALYDVLRDLQNTPPTERPRSRAVSSTRWVMLVVILFVAGGDLALLWRRCRYGDVLRRRWRRWVVLPPIYHACALLALIVLYALTRWPEWILIELALVAALLYVHPCWALIGAVFGIPFFYWAKPIGRLRIPPAETFLILAVIVNGIRSLREGRWREHIDGWSAVDLLWVFWIALGALSPLFAPDPPLAWREWRLCMLDPALLYCLLRLEGGREPLRHRVHGERTGGSERCVPAFPGLPCSRKKGEPRRHRRYGEGSWVSVTPWLFSWMLSGAAVALVAIGQWIVGALVPAGNVGRVTGVYYSPNHLALYLGRIWPLPLALACCGALERHWRWGAWATTGVLGLALYLTYSRGAWLLAVPMVLLVIGWSFRRRYRWWMVLAGGGTLLLVIANVLYGRAATTASVLTEIRIPVWHSTLEMIADHPWLGVGLDGFRFVYPRYMRAEAWSEPLLYHPHNMWLDVTVRLGLPGLMTLCALIVFCLYSATRLARNVSGIRKGVAIGLLAGLCAALAHGLVDGGYFLADLAWSLALVAGTLSHIDRNASA